MELFLELQNSWPEDSPHCLVILHEIFQHAAIEGQKEVERTIHQGCSLHMPWLNPEAGAPAIQLVGLDTTKEELRYIWRSINCIGFLVLLLASWPFGRK